jgi:hypothetical protein
MDDDPKKRSDELAVLARLKAERALRAEIEANIDNKWIVRAGQPPIFSGVPRPASGMSSAAPTNVPSATGREQPPRQRPDPTQPTPARTKPIGPQYVSIVIESGEASGWPDKVSEAFYVVEGTVLRLCHNDGRMLDDDKWRHVLTEYEDPKVAAERLLKQRAGVSTPFNATKIRYPKTGTI